MEAGTTLHISMTAAPPRSSASWFLCVRKAMWLALVLLLIIILVMAIAWSVLKPQPPGFRVSSVSVSNFSVTDSHLKGKYEIDVNITNPNKRVDVNVDHFIFFVCYDSMVVSAPEPVLQQTLLIYVEKMREKDMKVELRLKDTPPAPSPRSNKNMVKDWKKRVVNFNVKMKGRVRYEHVIWGTEEKFLDIYCGDLDVEFFTMKDTGKLLGVGKDCNVTTLEQN
ncbi:hypothetical protein HN51_019358 [Arachis hypogaea]|uniref:NDR1/HIN1-like protein 1 n=2 Tax=Arachis TaxID=3817 RepID=A0A6P4C203_ARADU|nr:NDR1/HIN1-like protein 1 [Arachis duranensis]XP_025611858.1 NDR1/HIN1-like protein 1 [Arachis hypogaea]XP_052112322.1 NDR1/HIN1-like protein 1 [Arachis duranensis]QHO31107.1 Harpin-induced [Arachis hypogaea]RYR43114.1 hypothetical protein Ahy_A08g039543 [Arachis hypogaea]